MGVRLYPIAKKGVSDVEVYNAVAPAFDMPTLTLERFEVYKSLNARYEANELTGDEYYETLYNGSNDDINSYSSFVLFGLGKFNGIPSQLDEDGYLSYCGDITDLKLVNELAMANVGHKLGVTMGLISLVDSNLIDGVYWC
jgi:hypothetical protein